jgi:hypothetical protein
MEQAFGTFAIDFYTVALAVVKTEYHKRIFE